MHFGFAGQLELTVACSLDHLAVRTTAVLVWYILHNRRNSHQHAASDDDRAYSPIVALHVCSRNNPE